MWRSFMLEQGSPMGALPSPGQETGRKPVWPGFFPCKRRGKDSNPRWTDLAHNGFRERHTLDQAVGLAQTSLRSARPPYPAPVRSSLRSSGVAAQGDFDDSPLAPVERLLRVPLD